MISWEPKRKCCLGFFFIWITKYQIFCAPGSQASLKSSLLPWNCILYSIFFGAKLLKQLSNAFISKLNENFSFRLQMSSSRTCTLSKDIVWDGVVNPWPGMISQLSALGRFNMIMLIFRALITDSPVQVAWWVHVTHEHAGGVRNACASTVQRMHTHPGPSVWTVS